MSAQRPQAVALPTQPSARVIDSPYLKAHEAAQYLRFASVAALYKAIEGRVENAAGERIPFLRRGRTFLFDQRELDWWLHGRSVSWPRAVEKSHSLACHNVAGSAR